MFFGRCKSPKSHRIQPLSEPPLRLSTSKELKMMQNPPKKSSEFQKLSSYPWAGFLLLVDVWMTLSKPGLNMQNGQRATQKISTKSERKISSTSSVRIQVMFQLIIFGLLLKSAPHTGSAPVYIKSSNNVRHFKNQTFLPRKKH